MRRAVELLGCLTQRDVLAQQGLHHLFFSSMGSSRGRTVHPPFGIDVGLGPEWVCESREPPWAGQTQERDGPELRVTVWPGPRSWRDPRPGVPTLNTLNQAPPELSSASPDATCELYLRRLSETRKKEVNPSQTFSVLQPGNRRTQSA